MSPLVPPENGRKRGPHFTPEKSRPRWGFPSRRTARSQFRRLLRGTGIFPWNAPSTATPVLKDITNKNASQEEPPNKMAKLDDLTEPSVVELKDRCGISLDDDRETHPVCGPGLHYTSQRLVRLKKNPVLITKEIPHCPGSHVKRASRTLSRPAPGRCYTCHEVIAKFRSTVSHGRPKLLSININLASLNL